MNNGANSYWLDCDYDSIFCSTCDSSTDLPNCVGTGCWINEGETGISFGDYTDGQTECCGDDSGEYLKTQTNYYPSMDQRQVGEYAIDWIGQGTTSACCNSDSDNINYDGQCITSNTQLLAQRVGASYTGHDMYSSPVSWYGWLECDLHGTGYCPNICSSFIKSGETAAHGEYSASDISSGTTECCGDDSGEYNQTFKDYPSSTISWGSSSYKACCDAYDCIDKNSNCKTGYNTFDHFGDVYTNLNSGGNDNIAFCYSGLSSTYTYWLDCDINQRYRNWCNPNCDSWDGTNNRCVLTDGVTIDPDWNSTNSICGRGSGVKAGESNVGEYTDTTTSGCCGDDANEYYKSNANGKYACCNTDSDVLDSNGLCQSFDFSLSNDGNKTITQGESTTNQITVTLVYGTTQQVNLSLKGNLPTGLTYSFSQTSVNPTATSTLTINTLTSTPAGNYLINVTGNSSGIIRSTVFNLTVNIIKYNLTLNKTSGYSYGTITSNPSGIDCGTSCNLAYSEFSSGTLVTLTATPSLGSNFYSWGNSCSGSSLTCAVTMDQAKTVTANFTKCSNSILEQGEQCDDGNSLNTDQCNNSCKLTSCGDSITQSLNGYNQQETCDYGALNQNSCLAPYGGSCEYCNLSCILNTNSSNYLTISLSNNHLNPTTDTYSSNKIIPVNITLFNFAGTLNDYYLANNQIVTCNKIGSTYSNQAENTVCNKINNSLSNCTIMLDSLFSTFDVPMNYSGCVNVNNIWYKSNPGYLLINTTCGDGKNVSSKGEQCDDGNQFNTDQCNNSCKYTYCGDLIVQSPNGYNIQEQCETTCTLPSTCYNITHVNKTNALCTNCSCTYSLEYCEEGYECSSGACVPVGAESCITNSDCSDDQSCCYGSTQYRNGSCITNLPNGMNTSSATESDSCLCMLSRMPGKAKNGTCQNSGDYPCWDTQSARCCGNEIGENWSTTTSTNRMLEDILILGYCNNGVWKSREDSGLTYYTLRVD
jgi:cysteine-rich repeat protein/VCBS repeat-containing protein